MRVFNYGGLGHSDSVTPLAEDEQRAIAYRYTELQSAINRGAPVGRNYDALCKVYRGKSRKFLNSFASARDKVRWARQLELTCSPKLSRNSGRPKDIKPLRRN